MKITKNLVQTNDMLNRQQQAAAYIKKHRWKLGRLARKSYREYGRGFLYLEGIPPQQVGYVPHTRFEIDNALQQFAELVNAYDPKTEGVIVVQFSDLTSHEKTFTYVSRWSLPKLSTR